MITPRNHALLFANGPYQLLVGVACIRKHIQDIQEIDVITYDMEWQKELQRSTSDFVKHLGLNQIQIPYEYQKSDISNSHTYKIRTAANHYLFYHYCKKYGKDNIFIPKIYGSPERAILLAAKKKNVFVYDDGFGQYVSPQVNMQKYDRIIYKFLQGKEKSNITIAPRKPQLLKYSEIHIASISPLDYTKELQELLCFLASNIVLPELSTLLDGLKDKNLVLLPLPRLSLTSISLLISNLKLLLEYSNRNLKKTFFLFKPHPRDITLDFSVFRRELGPLGNSEIISHSLWAYPTELLFHVIHPEVILSGTSTVGINSDIMDDTRVFVFDFLSFNLPNYNDHARQIMVNSGTYKGSTVNDAIDTLQCLFAGNLKDK